MHMPLWITCCEKATSENSPFFHRRDRPPRRVNSERGGRIGRETATAGRPGSGKRGAGNLGTCVAVKQGGKRSYECGVQSESQKAKLLRRKRSESGGCNGCPFSRRTCPPRAFGTANGRQSGFGIRGPETRPGRRLDWASGQALEPETWNWRSYLDFIDRPA